MGSVVVPATSWRLLCSLPLALAISCASAPVEQQPQSGALPWERAVDSVFENKGVATIDRLGDRWVLRVQCGGTHVTYIDETTTDLADYRGAYVRARYRWVERLVKDPKCVLPPCRDITHRILAIEAIEKLPVTAAQASALAAQCK